MSAVAVRGRGADAVAVAAGLAALGHQVACPAAREVDGTEPGLAALVRRTVRSGALRAEHGADPDCVLLRGTEAGRFPADRMVVDCRVPPDDPGDHGACVPLDLRPGSLLEDFLHPEYLVIGADTESAAARAEALFRCLGAEIVHVDPRSAGLVVPVGNGFRALKRRFFGSLEQLCEAVGADPATVVECLRYDERINCGTEPDDPRATGHLVHLSRRAGPPAEMFESIVDGP
ncbi:hypothetical protein GCM10025787_29280 [Saccharopolyspora rosea]|uniref:Uncharacterized protein n=1 Tax=Saccharopolyspora rosea TaxID=524884 RepID=A0ABW3G3Q9_9PSEU